ncbi:glycosyltransferase, partial [candidate division FCPU426 bacterium]|nr:glycosyltransferase [candidate division FCPU426 bacterium]
MEPTNVLFYLQPHTIRNNPLAFEWIFLNYLKVARGLAGKKVACSFLVDDQIKARYQDLPCQIISPSDYGVVFDTSHWPEYWHEILTNPRHEQKSRLLEQVFQEHTYHYVFCWNYDAVLDRVCKEKGCRVIYQELGMTRKPLLYQMDFEGLLWKSSLQRLYGKLKDQVSYDPARLDSFLRIMKNKPLRPRQEIIRDLQLDEKKPILLIPLQVEDDSNIVVGSPFKCMDDFIRFCLGGIRDIEEYNVIIKKHPVQADFALDPALSRKDIWQRQVRVLLNEIDNMSLIKAADTIVTINSSAGFEGLCFGKKVMTLGKSPYSHLGVTADLDSQRQFALADHEPFFTSLYRQDSLLVPRFLHFAIFHYQIPSYQVFSEEYYLDLFRQLAVEKDVDTVYLRRQEQQPAVCDSALYHAEIEIEELREESRLRTEYMQKLEREIARKEMDVQNVKNELQHRSNKLEERNSYIGKLEADLQKVLHDLSVIIQARAFKIVSKYYLFRNRILPFGSRRRKFVKFFLVDMLRLLKRVLHEGKNGWKQFWINWQTTVPVEDPQLLSLDLLLRRKSSEYERARLTGADSSSLLKNLEYAAQIRLQVFLSSEQTLEFPVHPVPLISIIIILYNRVAASFQCLESILAYADVPYEIILVDNASADETAQWLDQLRNLQVVRNANNEGFLKACNQAAALAKGKYFLFLNNDTQISPKLLSTMFATLENDASIGLVGGRLIF